MTQITSKDREILLGKCRDCEGFGILKSGTQEFGKRICGRCSGTGQGSIKIEKEWVECGRCRGKGWVRNPYVAFKEKLCTVKGCLKGKIPKYKVGEEIDAKKIDRATKHGFPIVTKIKLKIISETGDKQRVIMVR